MGRRTTKVREGDWRSVEKAIDAEEEMEKSNRNK